MHDGRSELDETAARLATIACRAGVLLRHYELGDCPHTLKEDGSPTSAADLAAEALIIQALAAEWPGIPVVAEESASTGPAGETFFLVDPLDGTRDFLHGTGEYSVNVALIAGGRPVAAALAAPALGRVWAAGARAVGGRIDDERVVDLTPIRVRPVPLAGVVALVSRRHGDEASERCLAALPIADRRGASSALKFGLIASGEADLYVRCGPTMEWDTAAGDHILACAGGRVVGPDGAALTYGHHGRGYRNGAFAAVGDPALAGALRLPS